MNPFSPLFIWGPEHTKPKQIHVTTPSVGIAGGITPGKKSCIRKKMDGNEDALGLLNLAQGQRIFLLADGHYGAWTAETAVGQFGEFYARSQPDEFSCPEHHLLAVHYLLDGRIMERRHQEPSLFPGSSTTLVSVHLMSDRVAYCSTGDSHFYLLRNGHLTEIAPTETNLFLGDQVVHPRQALQTLARFEFIDSLTSQEDAVTVLMLLSTMCLEVQSSKASLTEIENLLAEQGKITGLTPAVTAEELMKPWHALHKGLQTAPRFGSFALRKGDLLALFSDGIDEDVSGLSKEALTRLLTQDLAIDQKAKSILEASLNRRGGNDNVSLWLAQL